MIGLIGMAQYPSGEIAQPQVSPARETIAKPRHCLEHRCHSSLRSESYRGILVCRERFFTPLRSVQNDMAQVPAGFAMVSLAGEMSARTKGARRLNRD